MAKGIRPETLEAPPFRGRWREDDRGNVVFPPERSLPGLWESAAPRGVARIVVTESAIDALSHYQLKPDDRTLYVSTGGPLSAEQAPALWELLKRHEAHARAAGAPEPVVLAAFSSSREGAALSRALETGLPAGMRFERAVPTWGRSWKESLQAKERDRPRRQGVTPEERAAPGRALDLRR